MSTLGILYLIFIILGAAGLSFWQYNPTRRQPNWKILAFLRFLTYLGAGLLLLNIQLTHRENFLVKPRLAIAVDNSKSIDLLGGEQRVRDWVEGLRENTRFNKKFDVDFYRFGADFEGADSFNFTASQTDISRVFTNLRHIYRGSRVQTILITDGNQTVGRDYEQVAKGYDSPISIVVVGDTATYADLEITRVNANRYSFLENTFPVEVFVNYTGNRAVSKKLTIRDKNTVLFQRELNLGPDHNAEIVETQIKAKSVGMHTYSVEIESLTEEKNTANNKHNFAVEVIDQQTSVLILASFIHPDLGAFKKSIEHNRQQKADIQILKNEDDKVDLTDYQLVLLYQPTALFKTVYDKISRLGMNTFTVTGTQTDYHFLNRNQNDFEKEITGAQEYFVPRYHPGYKEFQIDDIGFSDFPPLRDRFGDLVLAPDYSPLLFQTIQDVETETPLLLTIQEEDHRRAYLFGENSWQWRAKSYRDRGSFESYDTFIGQMVQYLASHKKRSRLEVDYNSFYNTGEKMVFRAHYFDENYQFDPRAHLEARVVNEETGKTQTYPLVLKNNYYELDLGGLNAGDYSFTVSVDGQNLSKSGVFTRIDYDPEKQSKNANYKKLKQIASRSIYLVDEDPNTLIQDLLADESLKVIQQSKITKSPLINWKYLFFIMLSTLTAEWFIRKYRGLI